MNTHHFHCKVVDSSPGFSARVVCFMFVFILVVLWQARAFAMDAPMKTGCLAVPLPPYTQVSVVAGQIAVDGLPMNILQVSNARTAKSFLQFYRELWVVRDAHGLHPSYVEYDLGAWHYIAHKDGSCFDTVQVHAADPHTVGLVAVSELSLLDKNSPSPDIEFPGGARVLTHMTSKDTGRSGDTWVLKSNDSVFDAARFFTDTLKRAGWNAIATRVPDTAEGTAVLTYQRGSENAGIVVRPGRNGGSLMVLTMVMR